MTQKSAKKEETFYRSRISQGGSKNAGKFISVRAKAQKSRAPGMVLKGYAKRVQSSFATGCKHRNLSRFSSQGGNVA